jgi:hypothetical protein
VNHCEEGGATLVQISALHSGNSPRLAGEDEMHIRALMASESELPPILVHRATMRVIDGMHRLRAARLRGADTIRVRFFDGDDAAAFVMAVQANIAHGLPLSLADREAAAIRIIASHPAWSDRAIAATTGLAANTVRALRCSTAQIERSNTRIGRDGRVRPLDASEGRRLAGEIVASRPDATVRDIAAAAGISVGTASDVCRRIRAGLDPVLHRQRSSPAETPPVRPAPYPVRRPPDSARWPDLRENMSRDPSIRLAVSGRQLLRWLDSHAVDPVEWDEHLGALPLHWAETVADQMLAWADCWRELAEEIRRQAAAAG